MMMPFLQYKEVKVEKDKILVEKQSSMQSRLHSVQSYPTGESAETFSLFWNDFAGTCYGNFCATIG